MNPSDGGERLWTVPNVLCGLRSIGILPLLWVAWEGHRRAFFWILVALLLTDWLDGKLAKLLDQQTTFGARFDSVADAVMYTAFALSFWWLEEPAVRELAPWIFAAGLTWAASEVVGLVRFGRLPSYHTWGAKVSWLVVGVACVLWILNGRSDLVPWALGLVVLTNLEAVAIGLALPEWCVNVPTLYHALNVSKG